MLDLCRCTQLVSHTPGAIPSLGQPLLFRPRPLDLEFIRILTRRRPGLDSDTLYLGPTSAGCKLRPIVNLGWLFITAYLGPWAHSEEDFLEVPTVAQKTVPMFACFALITILCNST